MIKIEKTDEVLEYKNFYFANVSRVLYNGVHFGWYYEDKDAGKSWYTIFFDDSIPEDLLKLPEDCHYGEDCIYCHKIEDVEYVCRSISQLKNGLE